MLRQILASLADVIKDPRVAHTLHKTAFCHTTQTLLHGLAGWPIHEALAHMLPVSIGDLHLGRQYR